ncbi:glycosyltransferase [Paracoccus sp. TOH]|uniref:glycosyltransferase n=1 Tax=Paracoccus sp. TOH TaxID=1263728 RepID=UPI0025B107D5|nr:glycosyltransferase [Paracoccus sp. TOH]WJS85376.1 glycosyltransferase [Paracoccus sp. TOH]
MRKLPFRKSETVAAAPEFSGHIDGIHDGAIMGWIRAASHQGPLQVDLLANGQGVGFSVLAGDHRPDVEAAGFGDGRYGFRCPMPATDARGQPWPSDQTALIELRIAGGTQTLMTRQVAIQMPPPAPEPESQPIALDCDGRIEKLGETHLRGWVTNRNNIGQILRIEVLIDGVFFCKVLNDQLRDDLLRAGLSEGRGGVRLSLPLRQLGKGTHAISLRLPDGRLISKTVEVQGQLYLPAPAARIAPADCAVIVPVYNAAEDVAICIERLRAHTPAEVEILFVDDASPDPGIARLLDQASACPNIRVLRNDRNLGFTATVNRGIAEIGRKHPILLNSDARVTPDWIGGLLTAAGSRARVATVTPMSDRAGAFSAPDMGNDNGLPPGIDEITFARAFRRRALGLYPLVPTGNGFCMFIHRACLDEIGALDVQAFPRGYGEENDFCMRAGRAGWLHLVDDRTYVFHDRSKSFGSAKDELIKAGRAVIDRRYPEYKKAIRVFAHGDELALARMQARRAQEDCQDPRATLPRTLYVVATQTGGTPHTNIDLMTALYDVRDSWLLRCDSTHLVLSRWQDGKLHEMLRHDLGEAIDPIRHASTEYDEVVAGWLRRFEFGIVHIRHLAWHSLNLPRIAKETGCRVVFSFHDFYTICPSVKLLQADGVFYGGDLDQLAGEVVPELWKPDAMPPAGAAWIGFWRERFDRALACCDAFVTTSASARARILAALPGIDPAAFAIIPHGRDFPELLRLRQVPRHGQPVRILVPGNIGTAKGLGVIQALLDMDRDRLLEFHVLGRVDASAQIDDPRLVRHGTYSRDDFASRVRGLGIHLGAVFSIWDETYCHTLTELWSVGIPALVFDFPTVAGRVRASGAGWVLPHDDIGLLYRQLIGIAFDPAEQDRADLALAAWQNGPGLAESTRLMAARYLNLYRRAQGQAALPVVGVVAPPPPEPEAPPPWGGVRQEAHRALQGDCICITMPAQALLANLNSGTLDGATVQSDAVPVTLASALHEALHRAAIPYTL